MSGIPFQLLPWDQLDKIEHKGETGQALWQTFSSDGLRIRLVEYSAGYLADHWCQLGHIVHCLQGEFSTELKTGESFSLTQGMTYVVSDNLSSHRSFSKNGVMLFIIDGNFLK